MIRRSIGIIGALIFVASCGTAEKDRQDANWMTGFWHMTADEDHGPLGEIIEFRANGKYATYDNACNPYLADGLHLNHGDIYVTNEIPDKGPVSIVFHPNAARSRLTFTSPRTKNNAVYERLPGNKCVVSN